MPPTLERETVANKNQVNIFGLIKDIQNLGVGYRLLPPKIEWEFMFRIHSTINVHNYSLPKKDTMYFCNLRVISMISQRSRLEFKQSS